MSSIDGPHFTEEYKRVVKTTISMMPMFVLKMLQSDNIIFKFFECLTCSFTSASAGPSLESALYKYTKVSGAFSLDENAGLYIRQPRWRRVHNFCLFQDDVYPKSSTSPR